MKHEITTWSYEMLSPDQFAAAQELPDFEVRALVNRIPGFIRFLWSAVGEPWYWSDRFGWTDEDWSKLAEDPDTHFWVGYTGGSPIGFFELHQHEKSVEIHFFGLLPEFIGKGYGGHLLNDAIVHSWELGAERVWLHTCNWDGPYAVANYEARGFRLFDEKTSMEEVPAFDAR